MWALTLLIEQGPGGRRQVIARETCRHIPHPHSPALTLCLIIAVPSPVLLLFSSTQFSANGFSPVYSPVVPFGVYFSQASLRVSSLIKGC